MLKIPVFKGFFNILVKSAEAARGKCALLGQISPMVLRTGNGEEVRKAGEEVVAKAEGKTQTGFIFGPGCALGGDTPKKNIIFQCGGWQQSHARFTGAESRHRSHPENPGLGSAA